ncbi:MAG: four helix bundle protein [Phycisphaerae bacterium]
MAEIQDRTKEYALRAIKLYRFLQQQRDGTGWILGKQYLRAATSIGANMAEAQSGESKSDFIHKCSIAQKEARESKYWLELLKKAELVPTSRIAGLLAETEELVSVITCIIVRAKKNGSE